MHFSKTVFAAVLAVLSTVVSAWPIAHVFPASDKLPLTWAEVRSQSDVGILRASGSMAMAANVGDSYVSFSGGMVSMRIPAESVTKLAAASGGASAVRLAIIAPEASSPATVGQWALDSVAFVFGLTDPAVNSANNTSSIIEAVMDVAATSSAKSPISVKSTSSIEAAAAATTATNDNTSISMLPLSVQNSTLLIFLVLAANVLALNHGHTSVLLERGTIFVRNRAQVHRRALDKHTGFLARRNQLILGKQETNAEKAEYNPTTTLFYAGYVTLGTPPQRFLVNLTVALQISGFPAHMHQCHMPVTPPF
ncbi:hypothetical protein BX661DRAFT_223739 [Kickxella alabastrina]|uniref:uncharacterized protein n=1 Tax=Kickxella alabastrina TaxID=61397 RepID=UPI00221EB371|nr:uncharacterized protein BX661DRAFT_223739 [Kickxella alabastrina]KAI7830961.1 hypothetical protein BX661DRAFT_223739 [Kickxella alabastrina]